jgi:NADPH:quinone reductase-like Zn-dependent oxidoreductase
MKAVRLRAPAKASNLQLSEEAPREPGAGEIAVRIRASSLNPHDDFVVRGIIPVAEGRVPLTDGAGDVIAVGKGVSEFAVGDAVVSVFWPYWESGEMTPSAPREIPGETLDGYARQVACVPAHFFTRAPRGYSHAQAATLPCAAVTAWRGLVVQGRVKPGDTVLVLGSGAVSMFALQFAKAAGARVIATSSSPAKLERLRELGADDVIDYTAVPNWGEKAKALTNGRGVDHVIEVGGPTTIAQSMAACRLGGHVAVVGVLSGFAAEVSIPMIFANQLRISGISIGSRQDQQDMIRAIEVNQIQPVVARSFPLEEICAAFDFLSQSRFGKVGIHM